MGSVRIRNDRRDFLSQYVPKYTLNMVTWTVYEATTGKYVCQIWEEKIRSRFENLIRPTRKKVDLMIDDYFNE
jgi:uridine kinase